MNHSLYRGAMRLIISVSLLAAIAQGNVYGQSPLGRPVTLDVTRQRLDHVLEILSNKGNFYFSYNSSIIKKDSLVTLSVSNKPVRQVLEILFGDRYELTESGNYVIIRRAPDRIALVINQAYTNEKVYVVSGYVLDENSGERLGEASVYEKNQLLSALTNRDGYFEIRLKSKPVTTALTVSKQFYQDTTIVIRPRYNQQIRVAIEPVDWSGSMVTVSPGDYLSHDSIVIDVQVDSVITSYHLKNDSVKVERTFIGRLFVSSKLQIQSLNLKKFFTERPFQLSVLPGVSTHGLLNAQVVNKVSLNIFGGYSAGVNGVELGGWFNIDKKAVRWVQLAGWFNIVGGTVEGLQAAGIQNLVLDSVRGVQYAGIGNVVKRKFTGLQAAGIYNHVGDSMNGAQMSGIANFTRRRLNGLQAAGIANVTGADVKGVQAAGIVNVSGTEVQGVQVAGIINYTKRLKGVQLGLINIADTSEGYSIGLVNVVLKGYHQLVLSTNEVTSINAAFKTGNKKLYSILQAGMNTGSSNKVYTFGYGIGRMFTMSPRWSLSPELSCQHVYLGSWDYVNLLNRVHLNVNVKLNKWLSLSAGPSFSVYYSDQTVAVNSYKASIIPSGYHAFDMGSKVKGWFGWNTSINLF